MNTETVKKQIEDWSKQDPKKLVTIRRSDDPKEDAQAKRDIEKWAQSCK